jgi:transcriptional regulator with XRE-family HTH domain
VNIPTCTECGEQWIDDETGAAIEAAADEAFRAALLEKADDSIHTLRRHRVQQRALEKLLGVSHGYLSKLRSAERGPSPHLVAALMLLARAPERVEELRSAWSMRVSEPIPLFAGIESLAWVGGTVHNGATDQSPASAKQIEVEAA